MADTPHANDRRFSDEEVALILDQATREASGRSDEALLPARGLSIRELQAIATEAGIDRDAVTRAALAVARGDLKPAVVRLEQGAPIAVAKTIDFGQEIDDRSWARMVVHLQETFAAQGRLRTEGALREWSNGNLRAVLEPTAHGHRLRISTRKGDAAMWRTLGNGGLMLTAVLAILSAIRFSVGAPPTDATPLVSLALPGVLGLGAHLRNFVSRRQWGRTRAAQMEALPAELRALVAE